MIHWEPICSNPLTGRKVWAVRSIPSGEYGNPFDWSMVVVRPSYFNNTAIIMLLKDMNITKRRIIQKEVLDKGFTSASALEKGQWRTWDSTGVRKND